MAAIRHVLRTNHWELQCPTCRQFVKINVAVMEGRAPFPAHTRWAPSWVHLAAERYPTVGRWFPVTRLLTTRFMIALERTIRRRGWCEPTCTYGEAFNWRAIMPPSGICAFGPLGAA